ncbi:hypothetical protein BGZ58_001837 [Dissophora ornata]|nr:hypothetical protein BGZ58_001837 [Dissophora ornata]
MSKRLNSNFNSDDHFIQQKYIVDEHPHDSLWDCASAFYSHFQFKDHGSATDAFRASLRAINKEGHEWAADFLQELEREKQHLQHLAQGKRRRTHTMKGFTQQLSDKVQRETLRSNADLLLAGNAKMTQLSLAGLSALPSTLIRTPSWHSESDEKPGSPVPFPTLTQETLTVDTDIQIGICSTPAAPRSGLSPSSSQSSSLLPPSSWHPPELGQDDSIESAAPPVVIEIDLGAFAVLNQPTTWVEDGIDLLATFHKFRSTNQGAFALARDGVADLSECSSFVKSLTLSEFQAALKVNSTSSTIIQQWPTFDVIASRVLQSDRAFDQVYQASKAESMLDPVAEYIHDILHSYANYFQFHDRIPTTLNEREGFADITWTIIRGALRLANIESRYLEVPVVGVEERKNAAKNLLLDNKEQAHQADGVGFNGTSQVYLAEASVLYNPEAKKRFQDEFKVKRDMRDSWISQVKSLCRQVCPPSGLSVFGSSSFAEETKFYQMDFTGTFRLRQVNSMVIPLDKFRFAGRLKKCIVTCLEFVLLISAELANREKSRDVSFVERQHLIKACTDLTHTSKSPSKDSKTKKTK